ncbi:hypothetical protein [Desertivirga xinjiangensis]|uniref:hypothetical protein n=1 Tax=Desertivirga xinjiangensis TaxID=539206 RepID=UPI002109E84A|nr:hypothetical protein [Pedobacter xinjiangensis]
MASLITLSISVSMACSPKQAVKPDSNVLETPNIHDNKTIEVIKDNSFDNGIQMIGANSSQPDVIDTIYPFGKTGKAPSWKIAQWASRFVMNDEKPSVNNDTVIYMNEGKRITFLKQGGSTTVGLEVNGSKEYLAPRKSNESWPHLLMEQSFADPVSLKNIKALNYTIAAKLMYAKDHLGSAFHKDLHTTQITFILSVQNTNKNSPGYRDYFWFGLPLYDYRYRDIAAYAAQDLGKEDATKKFISFVASNELFSGSMHDGNWITINKDIYPLLISAFKLAQQRGFLKGSTIDDMGLSSTNLGWEVPGTYDSGILLKDLKLTATLK